MDEQLNRNRQENAPELVLGKRNAIKEEVDRDKEIRRNRIERDAVVENHQENVLHAPEPLAINAPVTLSKTPISREMKNAVNKLLSWEGLDENTSKKIYDKGSAFLRAKTQDESAVTLHALIKEALTYMDAHKGYRFTKSGENRKKDIRAFLKTSSEFIVNAGSAYLEKYGMLLQNMREDHKYEESFKHDVYRALDRKYGNHNIEERMEAMMERENLRKQRVRELGGTQAYAAYLLDRRAVLGDEWKHDVPVVTQMLESEEFLQNFNAFQIPELSNFSDEDLLLSDNLEKMRKEVYLPMRMNMEWLIKSGRLEDMDQIIEVKAKMDAFGQVMDLYDARLQNMAGRLNAEELKNKPAYRKYNDELTDENERKGFEDYELRIKGYKDFVRENNHRKVNDAQARAQLYRLEKERAKGVYDTLFAAQTAEHQRELNRIAENQARQQEEEQARQQAQQRDRDELANMMANRGKKNVRDAVIDRERKKDGVNQKRLDAEARREERRQREMDEAQRAELERQKAEALQKRREAFEGLDKSRADLLKKEQVKDSMYDSFRSLCAITLSELSGLKEEDFEEIPTEDLYELSKKVSIDVEDESKVSKGIQDAVKNAKKTWTEEALYAKMKEKRALAKKDPLREVTASDYAVRSLEKRLAKVAGKNNDRQFNRKGVLKTWSSFGFESCLDAVRTLTDVDMKTAKENDIVKVHKACVTLFSLHPVKQDAGILQTIPVSQLYPLAMEVVNDFIKDSGSFVKNAKDNHQKTQNLNEQLLKETEETGDPRYDKLRALKKELDDKKKNGESVDAVKVELRQYCARTLSEYCEKFTPVNFENLSRYSDDDLYDIATNIITFNEIPNDVTKDARDELREICVNLLTKITGRPAEDFVHIPMEALTDIVIDAHENIQNQKKLNKVITDVLGELKDDYPNEELTNDITKLRNDMVAAKEAMKSAQGEAYDAQQATYDKAQAEVRDLCIYTLLREKTMQYDEVAKLSTMTLIAMAQTKLTGTVKIEDMNGYVQTAEQLIEHQPKTIFEQTKAQRLADEEKKKKVKKDREKTGWNNDAQKSLNLFGDIISGEVLFDEKGNQIPEDMRLNKVLHEHVTVLVTLFENRKAEKANKGELQGAMKELLTNVTNVEGRALRVVKEVMDAVLDAMAGLAKTDKKITKAELTKLIDTPEVAQVLAGADEKILSALMKKDEQKNAKEDDPDNPNKINLPEEEQEKNDVLPSILEEMENQMSVVTDDIFDNRSQGFPAIDADHVYAQFFNYAKNKENVQARLNTVANVFEEKALLDKESVECIRTGNYTKEAKQNIKTVLDDKENLKVLEEADPIFEQLENFKPELFSEKSLHANDKKESKEEKERRELQESRLEIFSANSGHGKFLQNLTKEYMKRSPLSTKRLMLACIMKDMKPRMVDKDDPSGSERAGRYFAALIKGAGPMMQKIFQGIPEVAVRKELQPAMQVVKSDLRDIPNSYVETKLAEIAKNTEGVSSIKKIRALGAASIAQTFLCEFTEVDAKDPTKVTKTKKVVKLLRPDAASKFEAEKALISQIAKESDASGVTEAGIQAHMKAVEKELDFKNEAENCRLGQVYNVKSGEARVRSVAVDKNVAAKKDYMVMELAQGTTVDKYIMELKQLEPAFMSRFYVGTDPITKRKQFMITPQNYSQLVETRKELMKYLKQAEKRQKHVALLATQWTEEALFGNYFHHGDLHAGNIMVSDDCATVLDYGNASKLRKSQMQQMVRMMAAALFGKVDLFVRDFEKLLSMNRVEQTNEQGEIVSVDAPITVTEEQKNALKKKLESVFKLGGINATGDRIFVALMKAQEVGIKIPAEIQNFSACEQRLENTLTEFNDQISQIKQLIREIDGLPVSNEFKQAPHAGIYLQRKINESRKMPKFYGELAEAEIAAYEIADEVDAEKLSKDLDNMKSEDFKKSYISDEYKLAEAYRAQKINPTYEALKPDFVQKARAVFGKAIARKRDGYPYDRAMRTELQKVIGFPISAIALSQDIPMDVFGEMGFLNKMLQKALGVDLDEDVFEQIMYLLEKSIPAYEKMITEFEEFREVKGSVFKRKKRAEAKTSFMDSYKKLKDERMAENPGLSYVHDQLHPSEYHAGAEVTVDYVRFCLTGNKDGFVNKNPLNMLEKDASGKNYLIGDAGKELVDAYNAYLPYADKREAQIREEKDLELRNQSPIQRTKEEAEEIRKVEKIRNKFIRAYQYADRKFVMMRSRAKMEPVLTPFFKQSHKFKTAYEDFRKSQEQWIKARYLGNNAEEKRRQMLLCEKEFMDEYRAVMLPILKERQKSLGDKINPKSPEDFIECMEKTFSTGRMVRIFKTEAFKYTGSNEDIPEEYQAELKKQAEEEAKKKK